MANVIFKLGTRAQYDALAVKDVNTLYWLTDTLELMKGEACYGKGTEATNLASGLMSAADKAKLDFLSEGGISSLAPVDSTIVVADSENGKTIGVRVSAEAGNALSVKSDGLFVPNAAVSGNVEFAIEKQEAATDGCFATYKLKRTDGDSVTYVGDEINIPNDKVLQSGTMEIVTEADNPYTGAAVGDPYIDLVLNDVATTHIYIPVKGVVAPFTAGDGIKIESNIVSAKINAVSANGLFADADGFGLSIATASAAGAMSSEDKAALDTVVSDIEDIKNSVVWASLGDE